MTSSEKTQNEAGMRGMYGFPPLPNGKCTGEDLKGVGGVARIPGNKCGCVKSLDWLPKADTKAGCETDCCYLDPKVIPWGQKCLQSAPAGKKDFLCAGGNPCYWSAVDKGSKYCMTSAEVTSAKETMRGTWGMLPYRSNGKCVGEDITRIGGIGIKSNGICGCIETKGWEDAGGSKSFPGCITDCCKAHNIGRYGQNPLSNGQCL